MRIGLQTVLGFTLAALIAAPSAIASTNFDALFKKKMKERNVPGAAYVIIKGGEIDSIGTYGRRGLNDRRAINDKTIFRLASVSKTFTGTLAAKLVEQGDLSLSDKVSPHSPDLRLPSSASLNKLNVKHVLSHTTGLMPNAYDNILEAGRGLPEILPKFNKVKALCTPGNCYGYQNILFSLAEPVIEAKTGESFEQLVERQLFEPLDMDQASLGLSAYEASKNRAVPHQRTRRGLRSIKVNENYYRIAPAAGVNASISDMGKWLIAHMGYEEDVISEDVRKILRTKNVETKKEVYKKLWRPYLREAHYGLGWRLYDFQGQELVAHGGAVAGFRAMVAYAPGYDTGIAILMNASDRVIDELTIAFWEDRFQTSRAKVQLKPRNRSLGR